MTNCIPVHGELHEHSNSGGTSDGRIKLAQWNAFREEKALDFVAILDHRQVRHMYQPEYDEIHYVCGTEPGTEISDADATVKGMHYNMLFPHRGDLAEILEAFPEYQFSGGIEGHFVYPSFTRARFAELIEAVRAKGGMLVHPHPMQLMQAEDANQYAITDHIGLEVLYERYDSEATRANYALWRKLLAAGRQVWACAGCDSHGICPGVRALTSLYVDERSSAGYLRQLAKGNFAAGPVCMRMAYGDAVMGGEAEYRAGTALSFQLGDAYVGEIGKKVQLSILIGTKGGSEQAILERDFVCGETFSARIPVPEAKYVRMELRDGESVFGLSNPIWFR